MMKNTKSKAAGLSPQRLGLLAVSARLFALAIVIGFSVPVQAGTITLDTSASPFTAGTLNQGWWAGVIPASDTNDSYTTGILDVFTGKALVSSDFRSFFTFDLSAPALAGQVVLGAELRLQRGDDTSKTGTVTVSFSRVTTAAATLNFNQAINANIFGDIGAGPIYASFLHNTTGFNPGQILATQLNATAVADINAAIGGFFSIGGTIFTPVGGGTQFVFGATGGRPAVLVLTTESLPTSMSEPSALVILAFGLAGLGLTRRRTNRI